jgi:hypothetical protein
MRSTFHPLSLDDFGISSDQGFLPHDPRESDCQPLNDLGHESPKLLSTRTVRPFIEKQHSLLPFHSSFLGRARLSSSPPGSEHNVGRHHDGEKKYTESG